MTRRKRRTFTAEFKKQMVLLYENEKPRQEIIKEYDLSPSTFDRWVKQYANSGSFKEKDNRSPEEIELIKLRKEVQQLQISFSIASLWFSLRNMISSSCSGVRLSFSSKEPDERCWRTHLSKDDGVSSYSLMISLLVLPDKCS